jgi:uncharacterized membrane protein YhaH (DUF805 family)
VWLLFILVAATQVVGIIMALAIFATGPLGLIFTPGLTIAGFASLVIGLMMVWYWCQPGDAHENAYGPPPPQFNPASRPAV